MIAVQLLVWLLAFFAGAPSSVACPSGWFASLRTDFTHGMMTDAVTCAWQRETGPLARVELTVPIECPILTMPVVVRADGDRVQCRADISLERDGELVDPLGRSTCAPLTLFINRLTVVVGEHPCPRPRKETR